MTQLDLLGTLDATQVSPGVFVVAAHGPIDGRIAAELRDVLVPIAAADGTSVIIDLSGAHGLDDDALGVVARAAHVALRRGDRLTLVGVNPSLLRVVQESGLDAIVDLFDSATEVIRND